MNEATSRLLELSGPPIGPSVRSFQSPRALAKILASAAGRELEQVLKTRNGFFAFESALLVRPFDFAGPPLGILQWNDRGVWLSSYPQETAELLFFAEDVFGCQFCLREDGVSTFDPETGVFDLIAKSIGEWADWVLQNHRVRTGWPLAHEWQVRYGPLEPGQRLLPKTPFVLGGQFALENLFKLNEVEGMQFRGSIASQIRDVPDGSSVILRDIDESPSDDSDVKPRP